MTNSTASKFLFQFQIQCCAACVFDWYLICIRVSFWPINFELSNESSIHGFFVVFLSCYWFHFTNLFSIQNVKPIFLNVIKIISKTALWSKIVDCIYLNFEAAFMWGLCNAQHSGPLIRLFEPFFGECWRATNCPTHNMRLGTQKLLLQLAIELYLTTC